MREIESARVYFKERERERESVCTLERVCDRVQRERERMTFGPFNENGGAEAETENNRNQNRKRTQLKTYFEPTAGLHQT